MPGGWSDSNRRAELPPNWASEIRPRILERDGYRCTAILRNNGRRCPDKATDVDHVGDRHDHCDENLASLCEWHHDRKSSAEGNAARKRISSRRPPERHPGLL